MLLAWVIPARATQPVSCPAHDPVPFCDTQDITPPTGVEQLLYAPDFGQLVMRNAASAVATVDLVSHQTTLHFANSNFTDMSISPSGRYLFVADYGGENIGYGTPKSTQYVHRLDLQTLQWQVRTVYIAGKVQAVSDDQFILQSLDQTVTFTDNLWGSGPSATIVNSPSDPFGRPVFYSTAYAGDFRYAPGSGRLLHGNTNETGNEVQAFTLNGYDFVKQEKTAFGNSAYFGTVVALATDESGFYYEGFKLDPLDLTRTLQDFPETIVAATGDIAFGDGVYYDAHTAQPVGALGFSTTRYGLDPHGSDFWTFDADQNLLRHFEFDDGVFANGFGD